METEGTITATQVVQTFVYNENTCIPIMKIGEEKTKKTITTILETENKSDYQES